jgi:anti-sigma factor ChrR (cupin superfamily)
MKINANFDQRVIVHSEDLDWVASPMAGVDRRALDRVGNEVARATTIVRYAPGSHFSAHTHTGGEEFVVLDGVFQDEHGDFPVGSYIRNPPESSHTPSSEPGCIIFVKLWQFDLKDRIHVRLRTDYMPSVPHRDWPGISVTPLYQDDLETVTMQEWEANAELKLDVPGGAELLMLNGTLSEGGDNLKKHSWLRVPVGGTIKAKAGDHGAKVWLKTGHLNDVQRQIDNVNNR